MSGEDHRGNCRPPEDDTGTIRNTYDWSATAPSAAVVQTVAIAANEDPTSMETLYDQINPDALDELFRETPDRSLTPNTRISFRFDGHEVHVSSDGEVIVFTGRRG